MKKQKRPEPFIAWITGKPGMKIQEVRKLARPWGVDVRIGRSKQDIIRDMQVSEGYSACYGTKEACDYDCLWKTDCLRNKR
jgi:hypothetical protein